MGCEVKSKEWDCFVRNINSGWSLIYRLFRLRLISSARDISRMSSNETTSAMSIKLLTIHAYIIKIRLKETDSDDIRKGYGHPK
jgi:hypothetical protein